MNEALSMDCYGTYLLFYTFRATALFIGDRQVYMSSL